MGSGVFSLCELVEALIDSKCGIRGHGNADSPSGIAISSIILSVFPQTAAATFAPLLTSPLPFYGSFERELVEVSGSIAIAQNAISVSPSRPARAASS